MTNHKPSEPSPNYFKETDNKSLDAGIANESAAYDKATDGDEADDKVAEGKWKSTDDGSGTSETD